MKDGYQSFAKNFKTCCLDSCDRMAYRKGRRSAEKAEAMRECRVLYDAIYAKLGEDSLLINRFDAAKNHAFSLTEPHVYHQGFRDCIYLLRWMGVL